MPATVGTSTNNAAVNYGYMRKGFYAAGLFWGFYCNGTNAGWEFTADPAVWAGAFTSIGACTYGRSFSIKFDGTYIHYARYYDYDLFYRRGTPENDGSITWSAVEQKAFDGSSMWDYQYPCISVDSEGYAWIGILRNDYYGDDHPYVIKNANNDGTWATDIGHTLNSTHSTTWKVCPVPLTGGKVYVIYCISGEAPLGKLYDAGWGDEENTIADFDIKNGSYFSATALGDDVDFTYNRQYTYQIRHNRRVWGVGWNVADVLVQDAVPYNCGPALSVDPSTGDLYCFWTHYDTDHVYYKQYTGGAWGGLVDWIDESTDDIQSDNTINAFYQDYGGYIGLLYVTKLASPYNVRFEFLTMAPSGWTGKISGVTDPASIMGVDVANIASVKGVA